MIPQQDATVIATLKQHGSDLSRPREIECYFYFPKKATAQSAAAELNADGFTTEVQPSAVSWLKRLFSKDKWLCLATKSLAPAEDTIDNLTDKLEALAARYRGSYDGWCTRT